MNHPGIVDIRAAQKRLAGKLRTTPVESSPALTELGQAPVTLKLEHHQITGSFKLRGASNALLCLRAEERAGGVVGMSTGNHGKGLAFAARQLGVRCVICMSDLVPQNKVDGIKACGAEVRITGNSQDEAQTEADRLVAEEGMVMVGPFDEPNVIAGQGTLGLEVLEQVPDAETILVPLSGGGLISGVAAAAKAINPAIRVIGISMERGPGMYESQMAGKPVHTVELATLADSLGGGIGLVNHHTFAMVRDLVDQMILVSEAEIAAAIRHAYWHERQIIEGSGSVGIAAVLAGKVSLEGPSVIVVSGGNIAMDLHHRIISGEDVDVT